MTTHGQQLPDGPKGFVARLAAHCPVDVMAGLEVDDEKAPLLRGSDDGSQNSFSARPPPPCYEYHARDNNMPESVAAIDALPPPYTPMLSVQVSCKVCLKPINIEDRQHLHVVKCSSCNEATPIKAPPPGKKYVRCPCNCLLVCKATSMKIACPRPNCRRIIMLSPTDGSEAAETATARPPNTVRVNCFACNGLFVFPESDATQRLARCPHCSRVSSVGPYFTRRRAIFFALLGIIFIILGTATVALTVKQLSQPADRYFCILWIGAFLIGMCSIARASYFCCVRVSQVDNTA